MNNKFNKVSFEDMLRYNGLIACEHELLITDLNKQPTSFSTFITKLGMFYSDIEIRRIFLTCNWYTVIREKGRVVDFNEYIKTRYTYDDSDLIGLCDKFDEELDNFIEEELNNIFDKIDKKVESLFNKDYILSSEGMGDIIEVLEGLLNKENKSVIDKHSEELMDTRCTEPFEDLESDIKDNGEEVGIHDTIMKELVNITSNKSNKQVEEFINTKYNEPFEDSENIVEIEIPEYGIDKDTLAEEIERYIRLYGHIYIIHNFESSKLGTILSYNDNKIKVELIDDMIPVFESSNKKLELVMPINVLEGGSTRILSVYINNNDNYIELDLPIINLPLSKEELKCLLDNYISNDKRVYLSTHGVLGELVNYNDSLTKIKVKLTDDKEILDIYGSYNFIETNIMIPTSINNIKKIVAVFVTPKE